MAVEYRVDLRDLTGATVAQFKQFMALEFNSKWCDKGNYQFTISAYDARFRLFQPDFLVDVWMRDPEESIPWRVVFTGIHKTAVKALAPDGSRAFSSYGPCVNELIDKETILWPAGSSQAQKSGLVSTVMTEFIRENIGPGALAASGRDLDGGVSGLILGVDPLVGPVWDGARARKPLLAVMRDLAAYAAQAGNDVDFRIVAGAGYTWRFECGKLGADRTTIGLDPSTGLNAAGNVPVVFSEARGNILSYTRSLSRYNTATSVVALGRGLNDRRETAIAENPLDVAVSPIARRTRTASATNQTGAGLQAVAEARLHELAPGEKFDFTPRKSGQILWRDYWLGDYITAEDDGDEFHKRLVGLKVRVSGDQVEDITAEYRDL